MIYTLTLNPSLDYVAEADSFNIGKTNRTKNEYFVAGGKGINVSLLLSRLGLDTTALGFIGGFTGKELERQLKKENINCDFQQVEGNTRINVKLKGDDITEFNASGVVLSENEISALKEKLKALKEGDWLCLAGSIPKGAEASVYKDLALSVKEGVKVVVDAIGEPLKASLSAKPFLVKPNIDELSDLFGAEIKTKEEIECYAKLLQEMGAKNVLVSMGGDGAFLLDMEGNTHFMPAHKGKVINTVGAGDSMIAGFICKFIETKDYFDSLKFAVAAGSATAFSPWLAEKELIEKLYFV